MKLKRNRRRRAFFPAVSFGFFSVFFFFFFFFFYTHTQVRIFIPEIQVCIKIICQKTTKKVKKKCAICQNYMSKNDEKYLYDEIICPNYMSKKCAIIIINSSQKKSFFVDEYFI